MLNKWQPQGMIIILFEFIPTHCSNLRILDGQNWDSQWEDLANRFISLKKQARVDDWLRAHRKPVAATV